MDDPGRRDRRGHRRQGGARPGALTRRLDYEAAQRAIDDGSAGETLRLLAEVGPLRLQREAARGGVSLPLPEQEVDVAGDHWTLAFRSLLPVEEWNAQISLLTGFAAASLMVYARVGLLRTLPPPDPRDVQRLHRTARALGIEWPAEQLYPDFIRSLDPAQPNHAAMVVACTRLLRGSGYVGFDGEVPEQPQHAALASEYAHVTAPLRRLGDRYAGEICVALCAGTEVPDWVLARLGELPEGPAGVRAPGQHLRARGPRPGRGGRAAATGWGRRSTPSWSRSTRRTRSAATSPSRSPRSRPGSPATGRCPSAPTSGSG